jgi:sugar lactone lactonase YvrE
MRLAIVALLSSPAPLALAHPGSGIVVDSKGQVFFQDSAARTIWKIDTRGKLTPSYDKLGGHWMALDAKGKFARSDPKLVTRITPNGFTPTLIVADGGAPITVNADGNLYYGLGFSDANKVIVGLTRIHPNGAQEKFAADFGNSIEKLGITGLASAPDGTLYAACLTAIVRLKTNATFSTLVNPVIVKDCDADANSVFLRGLDVDARGNVYAAACGCRCVIKVSADGKVETVLKCERPWSPTGVALHRGDLYVLEYTNANGSLYDGWRPRVRKLARNGKVTTLATISEHQQSLQRNKQ